ncbi:integrating conjugative element protein PilL%2C PFGI-1 class [Legionella pneumophila]|uniref:PFGI-1 class ICE element type IV pilus protein PilL2 n=1 Tax=Legionella pneumophila TaxID=446 RepID=UPI000770A748|nr:integrating conjugative element protein PilL%2C PFGI-1 class [Legionella pneumophila]
MNSMIRLPMISVLSVLACSSIAANVTQVNRYATVANKPLAAQINPLLAVQQVHFPQEVQTIGQAIEWWLRFSGFSLISKEKQPESLQAVMRQALPQIDRTLGPLTVKDGLEVLVGQQSFALIEDPLLRQVNFKLKPSIKTGSKS